MHIEEIMICLKQSPMNLYSRLDKYLQQKGFKRGAINKKLYIKIDDENILIILVYVDDIIGSYANIMNQRFEKEM